MNFYQIAILLSQGILVSLLILMLFHLRKKLGIGILFACLGLFQFMQVFLSSTVYVELAKNFLVSPGSSVLFTASLFAVLIIYIKEDASETRKIIYALLITNIIMSILIQSFGLNIKESSTYNPFNVSTNLFDNNAWVLFIGTIALFFDSLLIIIIFEFTYRHLSNLFLQICLTMLIVVSFDTTFFSIIAFWNYDNLNTILVSGLISKGFFAIFYSVIFSIYLKCFDTREFKTDYFKINDVFKPLTYRQKFEIAKSDALKTSEEVKLKEIKYQTLTNTSSVGIFHTRSDGYTTFVNPKWCEISGMSMNEALGDGWFKAVHPDDTEKIKNEWKQAIIENRTSESQYRFLLSDGSTKWVLGRAVPEINDNNQTIGYVGTITDITKIKLFEQEQILLKEKAEESDRLKTAFLANMSHEIRTPLNSIIGFSNIISKKSEDNEENREMRHFVEYNSNILIKIIDDIIDISQIEAGIIKFSPEPVNCHLLLSDVYKSQKQMLDDSQKGHLQLIYNKHNDDVIINADKFRLIQIVNNLISNAIKYTEEGTVVFGFSLIDNNIHFYVKDTGIGIPKNEITNIFSRFYKVTGNYETLRGVGLGLAIVKQLVERMGGTIWVESEIKKGSIFYFSIPYQKANISVSEAQIKCDPSELKGKLALVAEDDDGNYFLTEVLLEELGVKVLRAKNGLEAVEICMDNDDIDFVLMDLKMPYMDGLEATMKIRESKKDLLIVALSAHVMEEAKNSALNAGCNDYITKPIDEDKLIVIIHRHLKSK